MTNEKVDNFDEWFSRVLEDLKKIPETQSNPGFEDWYNRVLGDLKKIKKTAEAA